MLEEKIMLYVIGILISVIAFFLIKYFAKIDRTEKLAIESRTSIAESQLKLENLIISHTEEIKVLVAVNNADIIALKQEVVQIKDLIDLTNGRIDKIEGKMYTITNTIADKILIMETQHNMNHPGSKLMKS